MGMRIQHIGILHMNIQLNSGESIHPMFKTLILSLSLRINFKYILLLSFKFKFKIYEWNRFLSPIIVSAGSQ